MTSVSDVVGEKADALEVAAVVAVEALEAAIDADARAAAMAADLVGLKFQSFATRVCQEFRFIGRTRERVREAGGNLPTKSVAMR